MLMQSDKAMTFSSAEQVSKIHVVHTLMPLVNRIEQSLNRDILGGAPNLCFDFDERELMRGDHGPQSDFYTKALGAGVLLAWTSVNEVCEKSASPHLMTIGQRRHRNLCCLCL